MFKVREQDFLGQWKITEFETKDEVFAHIAGGEMTQRTEIDGAEFEGNHPTYDEIMDWLHSDDEPVAERDATDDLIDEVSKLENQRQLAEDEANYLEE